MVISYTTRLIMTLVLTGVTGKPHQKLINSLVNSTQRIFGRSTNGKWRKRKRLGLSELAFHSYEGTLSFLFFSYFLFSLSLSLLPIPILWMGEIRFAPPEKPWLLMIPLKIPTIKGFPCQHGAGYLSSTVGPANPATRHGRC